MVCKFCNNNIADDSVFCPNCGSKQEAAPASHEPMSSDLGWGMAGDLESSQPAQQWAEPAPQPQWNTPAEPAWNAPAEPAWNAPVEPAWNAPAEPAWNAPAEPAWNAPTQPAWNAPAEPVWNAPAEKPKSKTGAKIGIIASAAVLVLALIVVVVGVMTDWFGLTGPVMTVSSAAQKTFAAGNFSAEISVETEYSAVEGTLYYEIDPQLRVLNLLLELEVDGEHGELAIYDDYIILGSDGYYDYMDISDQMDDFFDEYAKSGSSELDWEELISSFDSDAYDELEEYIDFDQLNECITTLVKEANSKSWLEENAGYRTVKENGVTMHILEPEFSVLLPAAMPYFEDAFRDRSDFNDIVDELEDAADELDDTYQISMIFGVQGGKLVSLDMELEAYGDTMDFKADFFDIGSTELNEGKLEDLLEAAMNSN